MNRRRRTLLLSGAVALLVMLVGQSGHNPWAYAADATKPASGNTGELRIIGPKGQPIGACPLKHTSVVAEIPGFCARVKVTQEFTNPTKDKIEAIYVFPLPNDAAVDWMEMKVGQRTIRGEIKQRDEARRIYEQAKNEGHVAALLDQERPNIFTQAVANIMPGESVTVTIQYLETLKYEDGIYQFVFPMVVGPRYMPGNATGQSGTGREPDTTQVPDASKISPPITPEGTRAGHDISIEVRIGAGVPIGDITSEQHKINVKRDGKTGAVVTLKDQATIPNRDFILKYSVGGGQIQSGVLTHTRSAEDGFVTLMIQPPPRPRASQIIPKEMIFVIDTSGSMMGEPIDKAKETMELCIQKMNPDDTFQLINFSNEVETLFDKPQPNTPDNQLMGLTYLRDRTGGGGTEMMKAIDASLGPQADPNRLRIVCFMTDGYVGNDMEILDTVKKKVGDARVFAFGIGSSVNRFLLDGMAKLGRGEVDYVTLGTPGAEAADRFCDRISNPVLTDISVDWGKLAVSGTYPEVIPDLFSAKPLIIKGRYSKPGSGKVTISGKVGGEPWKQTLDVVLPANEPKYAALPALWARSYIDDLMEQDYSGIQQGKPNSDIEGEITKVALEFHLMSQYTSMVAVEDTVVTQGGKPVKVTVPVEMPQGVSYEGIFGDVNANFSVFANPAAPATSSAMGLAYGGVALKGTAPSGASSGVSRRSLATAGSYAYEDVGVVQSRLDPELQKLADAWKKDGKAPADSKAKVESGRASVVIWMTAVTPENIEKLKALGCEIRSSSKSSKMALAWIPIGKLEEVWKLDFVNQVLMPEYRDPKPKK